METEYKVIAVLMIATSLSMIATLLYEQVKKVLG